VQAQQQVNGRGLSWGLKVQKAPVWACILPSLLLPPLLLLLLLLLTPLLLLLLLLLWLLWWLLMTLCWQQRLARPD
jgi:hypothetical protein